MSNASIVPNNRAHDLYQVKMAIQAHTKRSQEGHTSIRSVHVQQQEANEAKTISGPGTLTLTIVLTISSNILIKMCSSRSIQAK